MFFSYPILDHWTEKISLRFLLFIVNLSYGALTAVILFTWIVNGGKTVYWSLRALGFGKLILVEDIVVKQQVVKDIVLKQQVVEDVVV